MEESGIRFRRNKISFKSEILTFYNKGLISISTNVMSFKNVLALGLRLDIALVA